MLRGLDNGEASQELPARSVRRKRVGCEGRVLCRREGCVYEDGDQRDFKVGIPPPTCEQRVSANHVLPSLPLIFSSVVEQDKSDVTGMGLDLRPLNNDEPTRGFFRNFVYYGTSEAIVGHIPVEDFGSAA
ncbi:uncharacterized protein LDX57_009775 [Aspergillus melleus]|uniref:uncharacterized protein n=1 Tax=Aspergillus melleus TaxID=138277 RepID=UPI001E8DA781|nr:uncharacterized protein LDX57_009775 [Aspergillus melleus]KAH8432129.1 hypothetical protein LDX57_009775 [Aspergillus melleus]